MRRTEQLSSPRIFKQKGILTYFYFILLDIVPSCNLEIAVAHISMWIKFQLLRSPNLN